MPSQARTSVSVVVRCSPRRSARTTMNLKEIAKRAGVSTATVSRAINRIPTVDPRLARRVWKVVDEIGYYPDRQARTLASGQSRIFGLIVADLTNPFFPEVVQAFEEIAARHNYEILLSSAVHEPKQMKVAVRRMIERRVDGVAILTFGMDESLIDNLRFRNVPLVRVDAASPVPGLTNICIDYQHGIRQAVQHLAALRHSRIAFVAGPPDLKSAAAQRQAFEESMYEIRLQIPREFIVLGDQTIEGGMKALTTLAALAPRPTAVLCSNDMTAIGVLRQASDSGIPIPQELSVIGFDDIRLARFTTPPLTTVHLSRVELATQALDALLEAINLEREHDPATTDEKIPSSHGYVLSTRLVLRGSTILAAPA
jgi:LacI family transcriptional regulator